MEGGKQTERDALKDLMKIPSDELASPLKKERSRLQMRHPKTAYKFEKKLADCREEEMNNKHAYDMLMMDLKNSVDRAEADRADKVTAKGKALQAAGQAKSDRADTEAALGQKSADGWNIDGQYGWSKELTAV